MDDGKAQPAGAGPAKPAIERALELWLFRSRWLMAPIYVGLVFALGAIVVVFATEVWHELSDLPNMTAARAILMALSLIDLSLTANLVLIVIFAGYENFVSKIEVGPDEDRPSWMGTIDFSGLKMKLIASIVAISAVALLRALMQKAEGEVIDDRLLAWLLAIHLSFVVSGVLLAVMDLVASKTEKH